MLRMAATEAPDRRADRRARRPAPLHRLGHRDRRLYTEADLPRELDLGEPGEFPYTRGVHREMYRKQTWTMRQYAGYASAKESNERYRYLLSKGSTGLSMAFDLPTQLGLDSDNPRCLGEVGPHGRGDRHDRRHAHRLRRHPARPGLHVDDDQRAGGLPAAALRAGRRGAGRAQRAAARDDPERRAQGVHRARQLHLPARSPRCA